MLGIDSVNGWAAGAATTALGLNQYYKGKKMLANNKRPTYNIPQAEQEKLAMLHNNALQGLPADIQAQYQESINRNQANASNNLTGLGAGLRGVGTIQQNANDAQLNFSGMNAQAKQANRNQLLQGLGEFADYQDQAFQINRLNPYYEKQAEGLAMQGAGMQNVGNSFQIAQGKGGNYGNVKSQPEQQSNFYTPSQYEINKNNNNMYNYNSNTNSGGMVNDGQISTQGWS
jgi:hypothetical protein